MAGKHLDKTDSISLLENPNRNPNSGVSLSLPTQNIDLYASKVNKLKIVNINEEHNLYKEDKL